MSISTPKAPARSFRAVLLHSTAVAMLLGGAVPMAAAPTQTLEWVGAGGQAWGANTGSGNWVEAGTMIKARFNDEDQVIFPTSAMVSLTNGSGKPITVAPYRKGSTPAIQIGDNANVTFNDGTLGAPDIPGSPLATNIRLGSGASLTVNSNINLQYAARAPINLDLDTTSAPAANAKVTLNGTNRVNRLIVGSAIDLVLGTTSTLTGTVMNTGNATAEGSITGNVNNAGNWIGNAENIAGRVTNSGVWTGAGSSISVSSGRAVENYKEFVMTARTASGIVTRGQISGGVRNNLTGAVAGPNDLKLSLSQTDVNGNLINQGTAMLDRSSVGGGLTNEADASATLTGSELNTGVNRGKMQLDAAGTTATRFTGLLVNQGELTISAARFDDGLRSEDGSAIIQTGDIQGVVDLRRNATLDVRGGKLNGSLETGAAKVLLTSNAEVTGKLKLGVGSSLEASNPARSRTLTVGGETHLAGKLGNAGGTGTLTITGTAAGTDDQIFIDNGAEMVGSVVFRGNVNHTATMAADLHRQLTVIGRLKNSGTMLLANTTSVTTPAGATGTLTNTGTLRSTGTLRADVDNIGSAVLAGTVNGKITSTNASGSLVMGQTGSVTHIKGGVTTGAGQNRLNGETVIDQGLIVLSTGVAGLGGARLTARSVVNAGELRTHDLTVTGGTVTNSGKLILNGTTNGNVFSRAPGSYVENKGVLNGGLIAGGSAALGGQISGVLAVGTGTQGAPDQTRVTMVESDLTAGSADAGADDVLVRRDGTLQVGSVGGPAVTLTSARTTTEGRLDIHGTHAGSVVGTTSSQIGLSGTAAAPAKIVGDAAVGGAMTIDQGQVTGTTTVARGASLTAGGAATLQTLANNGTVAVTSTGNLVLGTTTTNTGTMQISGRVSYDAAVVDRTLTNAGTLNVNRATIAANVVNNATMTMSGTAGSPGTVAGTLTNAATGKLTIAGTTRATALNNAGKASIEGRFTGPVTNTASLSMTQDGAIDGALTNAAGATALLAGSVGSVVNDGTATIRENGTLTTGAPLQNNSALVMGRNSGVVGDIVNAGTVSLRGASTVQGNFTNNARLDNAGSAGATSLTVSGTFTSSGEIVALGGRRLAILAGNILNTGTLVGAVDLGASIVNQGTLTLQDPSRLRGSLSNRATGIFTISGDTNAGGNAITNAGSMTVTATGRLTNGGTLLNTSALSNSGVIAARVTNQGTITGSGQIIGNVNNSGSLTGAAITGNLTNIAASGAPEATATLTGAVSGDLRNNGRASVGGRVGRGVVNEAPGRLTIGAGVGGTVQNAGAATIRGDVAGSVTNSGTLMIGGFARSNLTNEATGTVEVARSVSGAVHNSGTATIGGAVRGTATNAATGRLVVDGGIGRTLVNDGTATITGGIGGDATNRNALALADNSVVGGTLSNAANLTGIGKTELRGLRAGALVNTGTASLRDLTAPVRAAGGTLTLTGTTTGDVASFSGATLNISGTHNGDLTSGGTTLMQGQTRGNVTVSGGSTALTGNQTVSGRVAVTGGTLRVDAARGLSAGKGIEVGGGTGPARMNVQAGGTVMGGTPVTVLSGGRVENIGRLSGPTTVAAGGALDTTGIIGGALTSRGMARVSGAVAGGIVNDGGTMTLHGALSTPGVRNLAGKMVVAADAGNAHAALDLRGTSLTNAAGARLELDGASITGNVANSGILTGGGAITGALRNQAGADATLTQATAVSGAVTNTSGSSLTATAAFSAAALANSGYVTTANTLSVAGNITNAGTLRANAGVSAQRLVNTGEARLAQGMTGALEQNAGTAIVLGNVSGGVTLNGGKLLFSDPTRSMAMRSAFTAMGGYVAPVTSPAPVVVAQAQPGKTIDLGDNFVANAEVIIDADTRVVSKKTSISNASNFGIAGALMSDVTNAGTMNLTGGAVEAGAAGSGIAGNVANTGRIRMADGSRIAGTVTNSSTVSVEGSAQVGGLSGPGVVDLQNGATSDVLVVGSGGINGGSFKLDLNLGDSTKNGAPAVDLIHVTGGTLRGTINLAFSTTGAASGRIGERVQLLKSDLTQGHSFNFGSITGLPTITDRIVYSIDNVNGSLFMVSGVNPAIGAISGNVTLTQSLIGSVVNRPTSPMVGGLASGVEEQPCGPGGWARAIGGRASADGSTRNSSGVPFASTIDANYRGLQVGGDLACFGGHYSGWDMAFGGLLGVNEGSTTQPVYGVSTTDSTKLTGQLTSITEGDFQQVYGGVYVTASKGPWVADLQLRKEHTQFKLNNEPVAGGTTSGLMLRDAKFSSDAVTLSGSMSYVWSLPQQGWNVVPTVGFALTNTSTGTVKFEDGSTLDIDDAHSRVGFVGASISRTFLSEGGKSAWTSYATGTVYKDFSSTTASTFHLAPDAAGNTFAPERLVSDNLGAYGELSLGVNYVRVLERRGRGAPRQFNASIRVDGRTGETLDSVGVTGQFRFQF